MSRSALAMILSLGAALALIPLSCVARARVSRTPLPRMHIVPDMDNQGKFQAQQSNPLFADGRAMRPPVPGTIALGELNEDDALYRGVTDGEYVTALPVPLTETLLRRGRQRYEIFCSPCHGLVGYGDGMVARRADQLQQALWVPPASLHDAPATTRPAGHLFNTVTNGIRNMPAYGSQIPLRDRWAIVAYLRVLQRSQHANLDDVPADQRAASSSWAGSGE